jgi:cytidylate kinase
MDNKQQQTKEDKLRQIAEKSGMTLRELNELFQQVMIEDEKTKNRMIEQQKTELAYMQNQLMGLQYRNESMSSQLLTFQLERKIKQIKNKKRILGFFGLYKEVKPKSQPI